MHSSEFLSQLIYVASDKFPRGHLLWTKSIATGGGGQLTFEGKKKRATHVMWFLVYGKWPEQQLNHLCDIPSCVETSHLYDGSQAQNQRDRSWQHKLFKCGHPKVPDNMYKNGTNRNGTPTYCCAQCKYIKTKERSKRNAT